MLASEPAELLNPPLPKTAGEAVTWAGLFGAATALSLSIAARRQHGVVVVALDQAREVQILKTELEFFLPPDSGTPVLEFPSWECLPYDTFSPHQQVVSARLRVLARLPSLSRGIVLTTCANLMQRLPPPSYILAHSFSLRVGQRINLEALRNQLSVANYAVVAQVMSAGEFALRGGVVDVYPMGADTPFRLDLFDDEIESIRHFSPDTQRSSESVGEIALLPAREFPMTESGITQFRQSFRRQFEGDPQGQEIYREVSGGTVPPGGEFFLPLFFEKTASLFDYVGETALWYGSAQLPHHARAQWSEIATRYENYGHDPARQILPPNCLYLDPAQLAAKLQTQRRIIHLRGEELANAAPPNWQAPSQGVAQFPVDPRSPSPYAELLAHLKAPPPNTRILLTVETAGRREALEGVLGGHAIYAKLCDSFAQFIAEPSLQLGVCVYPLERGLRLPQLGLEVIAESQLYGETVYAQRHARPQQQSPEAVIRSLAELNEGDPVVHIEHGVGRYRGLCELELGGQHNEFVALEYQDNARVYVPVMSLHLINRFVGGAAEHAPLHRLGGERWHKARSKARQKAYDVAAELLELEALRKARAGRAFEIPCAEYAAFVSRFGFEETPDQARTIAEVRADLESPQPMDRLVCGDVGFGKTEVALRAAFIAAHNNCQVAVLAPTTILAQQHFETFCDRFADLGVSIGLLSRFSTPKQAQQLVTQLRAGRPDIVIGTHRLLQDDVGFANLGLLIIDEEHRFGVRQKEKIKKLRSQVDLLTLTATPIPRTLNLALAGLRKISLIATAPPLRLSIKTFIRESSDPLIREACLREIRRGGQVYFVHNEVRSMARFATELTALVPEAEIRFAHGQMRELQLAQVMQDFYHRRFNILICSTIIESGLDIPNANTIIIQRADKFGLAQLHQLRGRVGRAHHQAFAYLLIPDRRAISSDARKRLAAFEQMDELGAGFSLASHDLEIRGAGELLGETQSGSFDEIGFGLYAEYLGEAVKALEGQRAFEMTPPDSATSVELSLSAMFPPQFLPNPHTRLQFYKRIASARDLAQLEELQIEAIDRFGLLPDQGKNLFRLTAVRLRCEELGIAKFALDDASGRIEFTEQPAVDPSLVLGLVQRQPHRYQLGGPGTLQLAGEFETPQARLETAEQILTYLGG